MNELDEACLRSVGSACKTGALALLGGLDSLTIVGLEDGLKTAENALTRAERQRQGLRSRLPHHARAVKRSDKAVQCLAEALEACELPDRGWPGENAQSACNALLRVVARIQLDVDGSQGWGAAKKEQAV